jgi:hypothetical protein
MSKIVKCSPERTPIPTVEARVDQDVIVDQFEFRYMSARLGRSALLGTRSVSRLTRLFSAAVGRSATRLS